MAYVLPVKADYVCAALPGETHKSMFASISRGLVSPDSTGGASFSIRYVADRAGRAEMDEGEISRRSRYVQVEAEGRSQLQ